MEGTRGETNKNPMSLVGTPWPWCCSSADTTSEERMEVSGTRTRVCVDQSMESRAMSQAGWGWGMWMRGKERRGVLALGMGSVFGILG